MPGKSAARVRLFNEAMALPPPARLPFVEQASDGDPALLAAVTQMLESAGHVEPSAEASSASESTMTGDGRKGSPITRQIRAIEGLLPGGPGMFPGTSRFSVRRRLGSGAFGTVYEVEDHDLRSVVALKLLRGVDPYLLLRFKSEFRHLVGLRHPNLVQVYELFSEGEFWFFTMELVQGGDFLQYVSQRRQRSTAAEPACDVERLRSAAGQLAAGIQALHTAGILHCDIKPSNVLVSSDGTVRLLDFGLVHEAASRSTQTVIAGTPAYMSPEQARGLALGPSSDWYSLGVMLVRALTGFPDRDAEASHSLLPILRGQGVPEDIATLCELLLRQAPGERPSGQEVIARLGGPTPRAVNVAAPQPGSPDTLVGRDRLLARLGECLQATGSGHPVVVNLHGRSGIGKSALVQAFSRRLAKERPDAVILVGRCHETEAVPFKALDQLIDRLTRYLESLPEHEAQALAPRGGTYLTRLFPVLARVPAILGTARESLQAPDPQESRERAFSSLQELISRLADRTCLVLVVDDLQWGDLDSATFLSRLLTAPSAPPVLFIASYRSEDVHTSQFLEMWRARVTGGPSLVVQSIEVEPLTPGESNALAERLLEGSGMTRRQALSIAAESGGSPFLIDQLSRAAVEEIEAPLAAVTLRQSVERRLARLPASERLLLETIALAGRPVTRVLAAEAAGLDREAGVAVTVLVTRRLLRVRDIAGHKEFEVYHDRLRETIVDVLPLERQRALHLQLARAYQQQPDVDPAVLAVHFGAAGDYESAARYSLAAAERASEGLAFERSAELYRATLAQKPLSPGETSVVLRRLAGALVNAGRGTEAAAVYLEASAAAGVPDRAHLKHLAAEQLLLNGHMVEGLDLLGGLASEMGIWVPRAPRQAAASLLWHGSRVALRGLRPRRATPSDRHRLTLEVYWSLAIGIGLVDVIRGCDFQVRHLLLALHTGHRDHAAMSMAGNAAAMCGARGRESRVSRALRRAAHELAGETDRAEAHGFIAAMDALSANLCGEWRETMRRSETAARLFSAKRTGLLYERSLNASLGLTASIMCGEWSALVTHALALPELMRGAQERGDLHSLHFLLNGSHIGHLARDEVQPQRALFEQVFASLPPGGYYVPHLMALLSEAETALYRCAAEEAWAAVAGEWAALSESWLLRLKQFDVMAHDLRARAAMAMAVRDDAGRRFSREATAAAARLERTRLAWARGLALLIRASESTLHGDVTVTRRLLGTAEAQLQAVDMAHLVAVCRYRRSQLADDAEARRSHALSVQWAVRVGVRNLPRVCDMLAPGIWRP